MRGAYVGAWDGGTAALRRHERLVWLLAIGASELYVVIQLILAASRPEADRLLLGMLFGAALILLVAMATCNVAVARTAEQTRGTEAARPDDREAPQHDLAQRLSLALGYCARVAGDPRLPTDLRELLAEAQARARPAAEPAEGVGRAPDRGGGRPAAPGPRSSRLREREVAAPTPRSEPMQ